MARVSFGVCWQVYGRQEVELPENVDANDHEAVKAYLESIWDEVPLPDGEYIMDSDELDPQSIEIVTA